MSLTAAFKDMFSMRNADTFAGGIFDGWLPFAGDSKTTLANSRSAFTLSAFYNGVDQLSNDVAKLPKSIFRKDGKNRFPFTEHPVNHLISQRPNDLMNAFDFWKVIEVSCIIKGNAYVEIIRNAVTGFPESLDYIDFHDVEPIRYKKRLIYKIKGRPVSSDDILHFKGFSFDGIIGVGVVTFAARNMGVLLDAQTYQSQIYTDRGLGYGVIESEKDVDPVNKKAIEAGFSSKMAEKSVFKVPMLDAGMKYKSITVTPAEAQFLETHKAGILEVCRWLNIAPHKLKDLNNANYSNIYQQSIEHVQDSMMPRIVSKEQEIDNKLFSPEEAGVVFSKFNISALLRGDLTMKKDFYTAMVSYGVYTPNEVRELEDKNPIDGLDEPFIMTNMQTLSNLKNPANKTGNGKNQP